MTADKCKCGLRRRDGLCPAGCEQFKRPIRGRRRPPPRETWISKEEAAAGMMRAIPNSKHAQLGLKPIRVRARR